MFHAIYSILIIINTRILSLVSQTTCSNANECMGSWISVNTAQGPFGYGYRSMSGPTTSITVIQTDPVSYTNVLCGGAYSCNAISYITAANSIDCYGSHSCANIDGYMQLTELDSFKCYGSNSCTYSNFRSTDFRGTAYCYGNEGCAHADINDIHQIYVYGAYGLYNATIDSADTQFDIKVSLDAYQAGFGAKIICQSGDTCTINCYGNGCEMLYTQCIGTCIINNASSNTILPITDPNKFDNSKLNLLYDTATLSTNAACNTQQSFVFDDYQELYQYGSIISHDGPICCRGQEACLNVGKIEVDSTAQDAVVCSAYRACADDGVGSIINNDNGPVYCEGYRSCADTQIITRNNVYCLGHSGCQSSTIIGAQNVYCSGSSGCESATIISNGTDMNVYLLSYARGSTKIHCNETDNCLILCGAKSVCLSTTVICHGTCTIQCDGALSDYGCPIQPTTNSTTRYPSSNPTKNPTVYPSINPTVNPTTYRPTTYNPTTNNPTTDKPTTDNPTTYTPTTDNPTTDNPTTDDPTTAEPIIIKPITKLPTTSNPTTVNPTSFIPVIVTKNFTITIDGDINGINEIKIKGIITKTLNITSDDIISTKIEDGSIIILITIPSNVPLSEDKIKINVEDGLIDEYGDDMDISVTVNKTDDIKVVNTTKQDNAPLILGIVGGVVFCIILSFVVVMIYKAKSCKGVDMITKRTEMINQPGIVSSGNNYYNDNKYITNNNEEDIVYNNNNMENHKVTDEGKPETENDDMNLVKEINKTTTIGNEVDVEEQINQTNIGNQEDDENYDENPSNYKIQYNMNHENDDEVVDDNNNYHTAGNHLTTRL